LKSCGSADSRTSCRENPYPIPSKVNSTTQEENRPNSSKISAGMNKHYHVHMYPKNVNLPKNMRYPSISERTCQKNVPPFDHFHDISATQHRKRVSTAQFAALYNIFSQTPFSSSDFRDSTD